MLIEEMYRKLGISREVLADVYKRQGWNSL